MWNEFKKFALKGTMIDLAIGVIIGGAVGKVITSLVNDILMPPIGLLMGRVNFTSLYINLGRTKYPTFELARTAGAPTINVGLFLNTVVDFFIISLVIFFIVRAMNRMRELSEKKVAAPAATARLCPFCKTDIPIDATRCPHCTSELTAVEK
ncbi:MAG: large conductance mechanosensitive channel protein MscL [Caldiserica bacterium]|nr:large conductance mechanosensitive channel protein MscL [Caldisericota bacterium]MCX6085937.1 large conductance mechanosensitive channel protein MscL [Caldisericota bacterium]